MSAMTSSQPTMGEAVTLQLPPCPPWCRGHGDDERETEHDHFGEVATVTLQLDPGEDEHCLVEITQYERCDWISRELVVSPPLVSVSAVQPSDRKLDVLNVLGSGSARDLGLALIAAADAIDAGGHQ